LLTRILYAASGDFATETIRRHLQNLAQFFASPPRRETAREPRTICAMLDLLAVINSLTRLRMEQMTAVITAVSAGVLFYCTTKPVQGHFDYTFRIADALLRGHAGLASKPSWLNEFVLVHDRYYSVFPLGAVLANIPAAIAFKLGLVRAWPARGLAAAIAAGCTFFFYRLTCVRGDITGPRRVLLAVFPVFATWTWCNLGLAGAWQIALGFALLGQAGSLYYTLVRRHALLAGAWFALAIGNRTELLLTLPVFLYLWSPKPLRLGELTRAKQQKVFVSFLAAPAALLLTTAVYNWTRFGSMTDFGYSRIPGVLKEPWYQHGLFSLHAIPWNAYQMLFKGWLDMVGFPHLRADPFGTSVFLASPFLFLLFRGRGKYSFLCWIVIIVLTFVLWCHGNPGGWQFSYRYGMILIPWMFLLIIQNGPANLAAQEVSLFVISVTLNGLACYEFLWTTTIVHL
jgi:hypothetical protein